MFDVGNLSNYSNKILEENIGNSTCVALSRENERHCQKLRMVAWHWKRNQKRHQIMQKLLKIQNNETKALVHPWEWPSAPWHRIHINFAGPFLSKDFFIMDAHSKIEKLKSWISFFLFFFYIHWIPVMTPFWPLLICHMIKIRYYRLFSSGEEDYSTIAPYFRSLWIISHLNVTQTVTWTNLKSLFEGCFVSTLVEIRQVVLEKKI